MKQFTGILLLAILFSGMISCQNRPIEKPDSLIKKDQFIQIMVDIYLIQGMNTAINKKPGAKDITETDLYCSVLKKYAVSDTVFVRSLMYYSSFPKDYEKMHVDIMNILNQMNGSTDPQGKLKTSEE